MLQKSESRYCATIERPQRERRRARLARGPARDFVADRRAELPRQARGRAARAWDQNVVPTVNCRCCTRSPSFLFMGCAQLTDSGPNGDCQFRPIPAE